MYIETVALSYISEVGITCKDLPGTCSMASRARKPATNRLIKRPNVVQSHGRKVSRGVLLGLTPMLTNTGTPAGGRALLTKPLQ